MPVFEPGDVYPIVLDCHKDQPVETQISYLVRHQAMRGQQKLSEYFDQVKAAANPEELYSRAHNGLVGVLVGWKNVKLDGQPVPFCDDAIMDVIEFNRALELVSAILIKGRLNHEEKKSSELPA